MDTLYIVKPGFSDPEYPGKTFYCWHCALIEGVLFSFKDLAKNLDVVRVGWPKPRSPIVEILGTEIQSVPLLILKEGSSSKYQTGQYNGRVYISDKDLILKALTQRHGFPIAHP